MIICNAKSVPLLAVSRGIYVVWWKML